MNDSTRDPRLDLDPRILRALASGVGRVAGRIRESLDLIRREPDRLVQTRHSVLAREYRDIAFAFYAVGYPLDEVRVAMAGLALAGLKVVELRGTEEPFLKTVVTLDPGDPRRAVVQPAHPPDARDDSLGNARKNLLYTCAALAAGEFDLAARIAALAGDPPDARWVGPRSPVCTPNDQHLAYAMKHLLAGGRERALAELSHIRPTGRDAIAAAYAYDFHGADHADLAHLIRALAVGDAGLFGAGLEGLRRWHERVSAEDDASPDLLLSLHGTGLTALAVRRRLIARDRIPDDSPFLARALVELVVDRDDTIPIETLPIMEIS